MLRRARRSYFLHRLLSIRYAKSSHESLLPVDFPGPSLRRYIYIFTHTYVYVRARESSRFTFVRNRGRLIEGSIYRESLDIDFIEVDKIKLEIGHFIVVSIIE